MSGNVIHRGDYDVQSPGVQALVLCKKEMIYRDLGLGTREALALHGNHSSQLVLPVDPEVGRHPDQFTKLELRLEPSEGAMLSLNVSSAPFVLCVGVYDKWRLYKIHNFVVKADKWSELARQVTLLQPAPLSSPSLISQSAMNKLLDRAEHYSSDQRMTD